MSHGTSQLYGVMEGHGAYNKHARIPAGGALLAIPFLKKAVDRIALDDEDYPVVLADYGSSQGKNSLAPLGIAIQELRSRLHQGRALFIFHIDQPSNDFNCLFEVLSSDPDRYTLGDANVFPCAIGRSFYEQVLPANSVDLGWSSYTAVWLKRVPSLIPGHFFPAHSTGAARAAFERQAEEDWKAFLSLRATEMRAGARLVVVLPGLPEEGRPGFTKMMDYANAVLAEMVEDGAISAEERGQMVLGAYARRKHELLAPFTRDGQFQGLMVEDCEVLPLPDAVWTDYERTGDKEALAAKQALFFRAVFMPSLAAALTLVKAGDNDALQSFADRLQDGLMKRLAREPAPINMSVQTIVLAKSGSGPAVPREK